MHIVSSSGIPLARLRHEDQQVGTMLLPHLLSVLAPEHQ